LADWLDVAMMENLIVMKQHGGTRSASVMLDGDHSSSRTRGYC
jgi:hypothetical protein